MNKLFKKICSIFILLSMLCSVFGGFKISNAVNDNNTGNDENATGNDVNNTKLVIQSSNNLSIDSTDPYKVIYKKENTTVGSAKVKIGENYLPPVLNDSKVEFILNKYNGETYQATVEVSEAEGYQRTQSYFFNNNSDSFPGDNIVNLDINANSIFLLDFSFEVDGAPNPGNPNPGNPNPGDPNLGAPNPGSPIQVYPIIAYFEGIEDGVLMDENGSITIPKGWTNGDVVFKARVCKVNNEVTPDNGMNIPDVDSQKEEVTQIEGIANSSQINDTVTGNRNVINISEDFNDYGKVLVHIVGNEEGSDINSIISVVTDDLISIKAEAPIEMSHSFASVAVDQAIVTKDEAKEVSIFFGNKETTLCASGPKVVGITKVVGGSKTVINNDGTANVTLPDLSMETTTTVQVTIKLIDNSSITRTVNIARTAILLNYDNRENKLTAGYVVNKGYLYNNKEHDDNIFDAYLQVMLYKDNTIVKYNQIKIDDKDLVNSLSNDESSSIELFSEYQMELFDGSIEGVNKASVFLTNGPVKYDSATLPSIEFGVGSGLVIEFGGAK